MITPYLQVRSDCLLYYNLNDYRPARVIAPILKKAYSGKVTEGAKKRIQKAIDILVQKSPTRMKFNPITGKYFPFRMSFVTLTFSTKQLLDTKKVYNGMLKPLLRKLRKGTQFSYVWKAEFQSDVDYQGKHKEHGGQLHYHIASNQVIPWHELRKEWNKLQRKEGYLVEFGMKHGHYNPNSVDIHSVHKVQNLAAYLGKYMSKDDSLKGKEGTQYEGKKVDGKVWDCSTDLKLNRFSFELSGHTETKVKEAVQKGTVKQIDLEHCTIFQTKDPLAFLSPYIFKKYLNWRDNISKPIQKQSKMEKLTPTLQEQINILVDQKVTLQSQYFNAHHFSLKCFMAGDTDLGEEYRQKSWNIKKELKIKSETLQSLYKQKAVLASKLKRSIDLFGS